MAGVDGVRMGPVDGDAVERLVQVELGLVMDIVAYAGESSEAVHSMCRLHSGTAVVGEAVWACVGKSVDGSRTHQFAAHLSPVGPESSLGSVGWDDSLDHLLVVGLCLLDRLGATLDLDCEGCCYHRRWESHHVHAHVPVLDLGLALVLAPGMVFGSLGRPCSHYRESYCAIGPRDQSTWAHFAVP